MKINFCCAADVFDELIEFEEKSNSLDRVLTLKIFNKIIVTPRFKILFDNLYSDMFAYKVEGEYNLSNNPQKPKNTMIHSLQRRI